MLSVFLAPFKQYLLYLYLAVAAIFAYAVWDWHTSAIKKAVNAKDAEVRAQWAEAHAQWERWSRAVEKERVDAVHKIDVEFNERSRVQNSQLSAALAELDRVRALRNKTGAAPVERPAENPATPVRVDGPAVTDVCGAGITVTWSGAETILRLAAEADRVAGQLLALQQYVTSVCTSVTAPN